MMPFAKLSLWVTLLGGVWAIPGTATAQGMAFEPAVEVSSTSEISQYIRTTSSGEYVFAAWLESTAQSFRLKFARSNDGGVTFPAPTVLKSTSTGGGDRMSAPAVAAQGNMVFVAWREDPTGSLVHRIRMRKSVDRGVTFGPTVDVDGGVSAARGFPDLGPVIGIANGLLYLSWIGLPVSERQDVMFRVSADFGVEFSNPVSLHSVERLYYLDLAATGDSVHVGWTDVNGLDLVSSVRMSSDRGMNFGPAVNFPSEDSVSLAAAGSRVFLGTRRNTPDAKSRGKGGFTPSQALIRVSINGGPFGAPRIIADSRDRISPAVAAAPGLVALSWRGENGVNLRTSKDDGETFGPVIEIDPGVKPRSLALVLGFRLHVAWTERFSREVFVRSSRITPTVFVPGVAGSVLVDRADDNAELWLGALADHLQLSLHPDDNPEQFDIAATEPLRSAIEVDLPFLGQTEIEPIYGPFLRYLTEDLGLHEYELFDGAGAFRDERLTQAGCDLQQSDEGPRPSLFLFPYDWRLDNALNAQRLRDYVACVRTIYPDSKINVVAHSMGSLLSRRYMLDQGDDHHVKRLITIGAPWLGAPKMLNVLKTGDFGVPHVLNATIRRIVSSFDAAHQLLPSRRLAELSGYSPVAEVDRDLNGDGEFSEFDDDQVITYANILSGGITFTAGDTGDQFHSLPGQDDWSNEISDVSYFHIYGVQATAQTIGQLQATYETSCSIFGACTTTPSIQPALVPGDGTVPRVSADRTSSLGNLNAPDGALWPIVSTNSDGDKDSEHNGMMSNPQVQQKVFDFLSAHKSASLDDSSNKGNVQAGSRPQSLLTISGTDWVMVSDDAGAELVVLPTQTVGAVPGVVTYRLGDGISLVALPVTSDHEYSVFFVAGSNPMSIEVLTGTAADITNAVRYLDLELVAGNGGVIELSESAVADLMVDTTGDGNYDTRVAPTVSAQGSAANDNDGPVIAVDMESVASTTVLVTISSIDEQSGPTTAYFSVDGTQFQPFVTPFELDRRETGFLYVYSDDDLANRSTIVTSLASTGPMFADGFED